MSGSIQWLPTAERVCIPSRSVIGARIEILLGRLPTGAYQVATSAVVPGYGTVARLMHDDRIAANRCNAIWAGLAELRRQWQTVPAIVRDLQDAAEDWEL